MSKPKKISAKQSTPAPEQTQPVDVVPGADAPAEPVVTTPAADPAPAEATAPAVTETEAPKPMKEPKAVPAPKAEQRNGISKPTRGLTLDVWNACDALKAEGKDTTFEALKEKLPNHNAATIRTQRQRHKTFNAEK